MSQNVSLDNKASYTKNGYPEQITLFSKLYNGLSYAYWTLRAIFVFTKDFFANLSVLNHILKIVPVLSIVMICTDYLNRYLTNSIISHRSLHTRVFKGITANLATAALLMSSILAWHFLMPVYMAISMLENIWDMGVGITSRMFGVLKNSKNVHALQENNLKIAESAHKLLVNTVLLTGTILLLNPVTFFAGCVVIAAAVSYSIADYLEVNPFRKLANKLLDYPLTVKAEEGVSDGKALNNECRKVVSPEKARLTAERECVNNNMLRNSLANKDAEPVSATSSLRFFNISPNQQSLAHNDIVHEDSVSNAYGF